MLPSRLFRNTGIPPPLRSLLVPHASLPANVKVMFRLRLGGSRLQMASPFLNSRHYSTPITSSTETVTSQKLPEAMESRLSMTFTCTVKDCGTRSSHEFSKRAYTKGIVIVQCPGCENRHLIADHLGWFKEGTEDGKLRTIEDLVKARGEKVKYGRVGMDGDIEYVDE
ncbi:DNL zinc finger-domain-containing protein [Armillaria borealis]|uniref:DNL zinc finger-domain-containing protein n=1 Tax=Armillaria borealis TaxID=47425 RepID=A0AA39JL95_9AGAR|nr:DNL zinc finger-domain-containing protein [Armillaria borealis]